VDHLFGPAADLAWACGSGALRPFLMSLTAGSVFMPSAYLGCLRLELERSRSGRFAVAETRAVVFRGFLIGALATEVCAPVLLAVFAAILEAIVIARVQSGLAQVERAAVVTVSIPVATTASSVTVVVAVTVLNVTIIRILRLSCQCSRRIRFQTATKTSGWSPRFCFATNLFS